MKIRTILSNIRELFWPLLEPLDEPEIQLIKVEDCKFDDKDMDLLLEYLKENQASEDNRRKEIESKATIFIGTFAIANTVLINLMKEFIFDSDTTIRKINYLVFFLVSLTIIYLCRAIQFAIRALKRRKYYVLGFPKVLLSEMKIEDKKREIFVRQYNAIKRNQREINLKVDYMTMAQEYFQRAVATVALLTVGISGVFIFNNKNFLQQLDEIIQKLTINHVVLAGGGIVIILCLVMISILFFKIRYLEKAVKNIGEMDN